MDPKRSAIVVILFAFGIFALWGLLAWGLSFLASRSPSSVNTLASSPFILVREVHGASYRYEGTVNLPTPCHELGSSISLVPGSAPRVAILLTVSEKTQGGLCAQVISPHAFSLAVSATKEPEVSLFINGKHTPLSVVER